MADLQRFRNSVTIYRKRLYNSDGRPRSQAELAKAIGLSADELGHRLRGTGRVPLSQENIFAIVLTLAVWETITWKEAIDLLSSMDYPLNTSYWKTELQRFLAPPARSVHDTSVTDVDILRKEPASPPVRDALSEKRTLYLQHAIQTNQWLMLPGGRELPLECLYVSLRADEMQAQERQAEHALYLQEISALSQEAQSRLPDPYIEFAAMRKAIARQPKMFMLDARNWPRLFGKREQQSLLLAEVVKRHRQVVILGDPGSGKTTLGKWLVLQFARALARNDALVSVPADLVHPVAETREGRKALDLGLVKLPVFVSIAQYARVRKPKEQPDTRLTLYEYLRSGLFLDPLQLPSGLSQETAGVLISEAVRHGQALVVLDGLDEVSDLTWRRKIMHAVRRFLQEWCHLEPAREEQSIVAGQTHISDRSGNQVIITSRPVGYQFDPLVDLPHYTVEEMDEQAITAFCHAWMQHVARPLTSPEEASRWASQLHDAIVEEVHPGVRSMAGNPLLLTIMAQQSWKTRTSDGLRALPARRVTLFEEAARTFYDQREAAWDQVGITPQRLTRAFGAVAYRLHASETAGFATEEDVRQYLRSVLTGEEQVEAVLQAAREVSGFLIARGEGVYGFLHRAVQEYFVAQHLVSQSEQATTIIMAHALNPLWREPVLLAFGQMSRPRYSEEVLAALFTALLDFPDPAGEVLPRRELFAMAACVECERVPEGVGRRLAHGLLSAYARRIEVNTSDVFEQSIQQALKLCQRLPARARTEVENVLCAAVQAEEFAKRAAAVNLIIGTGWDAPPIAEALVTAWRTYADPAGSLLVAIEELHQRQPGWFHEQLLPLKHQIAEKPYLWEYAKAHPEWQHLLQVLYLPPNPPFTLGQINRDSPLTEEIMTVLELALDDPDALHRFRQHLHIVAGQPGTALARDAALVLIAAGEDGWINAWRESVKGQESLARPVLAALTFFYFCPLYLDSNLDLVRDLARISTSDLALINELFASAYDHTSALSKVLSGAHDLACAQDLANTFDLARTHDFANTFDLSREQLDKIEHILQSVKERWLDYADLVQKLDTAMATVEYFKQQMHRFSFIGKVLVTLVNIYQEARKDDSSQSRTAALQLTDESFPRLMEHLVSPNDEQRRLAWGALVAPHDASALGKKLIESMARRSLQLSGNSNDQGKRLVQTRLEQALRKITHDQPDWIRAWIDEASQTQEETPAAQILANIHRATLDAFAVLIQALPTTVPHIRIRLLSAFKHLVEHGVWWPTVSRQRNRLN